MRGRFFRDERGSPSVEMVLVLPVLLVLLFGGFEAGHFVWTQHKLTMAVRDGARFAARMPVDKFCEDDTAIDDPDAQAAVKAVTLTGALPPADGGTAPPVKVARWTADEVHVIPYCGTFSASGIYTDLNNEGPIIMVEARNVEYPSLFQSLGLLDSSIRLSARSYAAVIGI